MKWQILPTGRVWVDPGGAFGVVPQPLWKRHYFSNEHNYIPMDLNSLLIEADGKTILVDTGLGKIDAVEQRPLRFIIPQALDNKNRHAENNN